VRIHLAAKSFKVKRLVSLVGGLRHGASINQDSGRDFVWRSDLSLPCNCPAPAIQAAEIRDLLPHASPLSCKLLIRGVPLRPGSKFEPDCR
jgi:hypothetical protein